MGMDDRSSRRSKGRQPILPGVRVDASTRLRSIKTPSSSEAYTGMADPAVTKYAKKHSESSGRADTSRISDAQLWAMEEEIDDLQGVTRKEARSSPRHDYSDHRQRERTYRRYHRYKDIALTPSTPSSGPLGPAKPQTVSAQHFAEPRPDMAQHPHYQQQPYRLPGPNEWTRAPPPQDPYRQQPPLPPQYVQQQHHQPLLNDYLISQEQTFGISTGSTPSQGSAYHQTQAAKAQMYAQGQPPALNPAQAQRLQMQRRQAQLAPTNATNQSVHDQPLKSLNPFPNKIIHADIQVQSIEGPKAQLATMNATNQSVHDQPLRAPDSLRNKTIHADMRIQSIEEPGGNTDEQSLPILDFEKLELASTGPKSSYSSYSNSLLDSGATRLGGSMYRGNTYSLDPSPVGSYSVSSASSLSGGPVKGPDIERALSNWARHQHRQGLPLSDTIIRDKARFFAQTVGNSGSYLKANSTSWLENFKQKNHLVGDQHMVPSRRHLIRKPGVKKADRAQKSQEKQASLKLHRTQSLGMLNPPTGTIDVHQSPFLTANTRPLKTSQPALPTPPIGGRTAYFPVVREIQAAINTQRKQIGYTVSEDHTNTFQRHKAQFVALNGPTTEPSPPAQGQIARKPTSCKHKASTEEAGEKRAKVVKLTAEQQRQQRREALTIEFLSKKQHIIEVLTNLSTPSDLEDDIQLTKEVVGLHDICTQYRDVFGG
jgi:hypothetical protein